MKINRLQLENIRSYEQEEISFNEGTLLLFGENGAGKSTILQAVFGGLYQTKMTDYTSSEITLDRLVNKTKKDATITLDFEMDDESYSVTWEISVTIDDDGDRSGSTTACTLTGESLGGPITGVRSVRRKITELTGMTPRSFVNSVYIQQGQITQLINADKTTRQEIVDGLLGLEKLDEYIERMKISRRELKSGRRDIKQRRAEKQRQRESLPDESAIESAIAERKQRVETCEDKIAEFESVLDTLTSKKQESQDRIDQFDELHRQKERAKTALEDAQRKHESQVSEIQSKRDTRKQLSSDIEALESDISSETAQLEPDIETVTDATTHRKELRDRTNETETTVTRIKQGELTTLQTERDANQDEQARLRDRIQTHEQTVEELQSDIDTAHDLLEEATTTAESARESRDDTRTRVQTLCDALDIPTDASTEELLDTHIEDTRSDMFARASSLYTELGRKRNRRDTYDALIETGTCPICEETHEETPTAETRHAETVAELDDISGTVDDITEMNEILSTLQQEVHELDGHTTDIESAESDVAALEDKIEDRKQRQNDARTQRAELSQKLDSLTDRETAIETEITQTKDRLDEAQQQLEQTEQMFERAQSVEELFTEREQKQRELDRIQSDLQSSKQLREEYQQRMDAKERDVEELQTELDGFDIEDARNRVASLTDGIESETEKLETVKQQRQTAQTTLAEKTQQLTRVTDVTTRIAELEAELESAHTRVEQATSVIETYESVKASLRTENLELLNAYANDIFNSLYQNETYQRLEIERDYTISLVQSDGTTIEPELSSGGEGTIVNLALRAGIYRLLAERQGQTNTLPPFILDEPTTYLDDAHVQQLQSVIETITDWDVPQVFVVSHDQQLIQNAETAFKVEKDPASEVSHVEEVR